MRWRVNCVRASRLLPEIAKPTERLRAISDTFIGKGIYDQVDAARLIRRHPETVARWTDGKQSLHPVSPSAYLEFLDVISLYVISQLREREVSLNDIRRGREYLTERLQTPYPFAHRRLATVGTAFFGEIEQWVDVGRRGQGAFKTMITDVLAPIGYGSDGLASVWKPAPGVWINPLIQTGSPCIEGTRVPTRVLAEMAAAGDDPAEIADDYALELIQVEAALAYEQAT